MLNPTFDPGPALDPLAELALACVHREYPYASIQVISSAEELRPPSEQTPAFCGSFDWHSCVHTHWALLRVARRRPGSELAGRCVAALETTLTERNLIQELEFMRPRPGFERPYGLAWLFTLDAEAQLAAAAIPAARSWADRLRPLIELSRDRFLSWIEKLPHPIRSGEHSQTAFAMGLILDAAAVTGDAELRDRTARRAVDFHLADRGAPFAYEPSGHDFLSPLIAEADLLARALPPEEFPSWLQEFWPSLGTGVGESDVKPAINPDRSDGKLAHLDGLNLSRAWMLEAIAEALPRDDRRAPDLLELSARHAAIGLESADGQFYEGGHWLASFAIYLITRGFRDELGAASAT